MVFWFGGTARFCLDGKVQLSFAIAVQADAAVIAALQTAAAEHLNKQFGHGLWSRECTEKNALWRMRRGTVFVVRQENRIIGTLTIGTRKPWAIDPSYFVKSRKPHYITDMAVEPRLQRSGIGRSLMDVAREFAAKNGGDALRLDAWNAKAGAGGFYAKCGFKEVGRAVYRNAPLIYYELTL